jgi:hypothetical protein
MPNLVMKVAEGFGKLSCFGKFPARRPQDRMGRCRAGAAERSK